MPQPLRDANLAPRWWPASATNTFVLFTLTLTLTLIVTLTLTLTLTLTRWPAERHGRPPLTPRQQRLDWQRREQCGDCSGATARGNMLLARTVLDDEGGGDALGGARRLGAREGNRP